MKIYTKTGDKGLTGLFSGERVEKNHPRLEAYGTADELSSHIGYLRAKIEDPEISETLKTIQKNLFVIAALLATPVNSKNFFGLQKLEPEAIEHLEKHIDTMEDKLPDLKNFILPSGRENSVYCHIVRTVCRRFERELVKMQIHRIFFPEEIIAYVNRLSDYFFVLARYLNYIAGVEDEKI